MELFYITQLADFREHQCTQQNREILPKKEESFDRM